MQPQIDRPVDVYLIQAYDAIKRRATAEHDELEVLGIPSLMMMMMLLVVVVVVVVVKVLQVLKY